jgi:hypothetical protein
MWVTLRRAGGHDEEVVVPESERHRLRGGFDDDYLATLPLDLTASFVGLLTVGRVIS